MDKRTKLVILVFVLGLIATGIHFFVEPLIPIAEAADEKAEAPKSSKHIMNNRDACLYLKYHGAEVRGASMNQVKDLCAGEGVILN